VRRVQTYCALCIARCGAVAIIGGAGGAMPDIANSGVMILWGYNPSFSRLTHAAAVAAAPVPSIG
jgi:hypothetical protein